MGVSLSALVRLEKAVCGSAMMAGWKTVSQKDERQFHFGVLEPLCFQLWFQEVWEAS